MGEARDARSLQIAMYVLLIVVGIAFFLVSLLPIITGEDSTTIIGGLLTMAFALILIIVGFYIRAKTKRFRRYLDLVYGQSEVSIELIAESVNRSVDYTIKDLQDMIEYGYFANAVIDKDTKMMIISDKDVQDIQEAFPQRKIEGDITLTCPRCGTIATEPRGTQYDCSFCNTPQAEEYTTVQCPKCGASDIKPKGTWRNCRFCGTQV